MLHMLAHSPQYIDFIGLEAIKVEIQNKLVVEHVSSSCRHIDREEKRIVLRYAS